VYGHQLQHLCDAVTRRLFQIFTKKPVSDAKAATEVLLALDASSKEEVNSLVQKAVSAGGPIYAELQDYGWMYSHSFEDLDGHQWEIAFMDQSQMPQ
jgi:predicted lactoylglutathione lyase